MELGLSLGGDTNTNNHNLMMNNSIGSTSSSKQPAGDNVPDRRRPPGLGFGFCMANGDDDDEELEDDDQTSSEHTTDGPLQLTLLPRAAVPRWSSENGGSSGSSGNLVVQPAAANGFDVNRLALTVAEEVTSPNSAGSTLRMDLSLAKVSSKKKDLQVGGNDVVEGERGSSRVSDEDDNGLNSRKKLRLSKEQSAFLEESFKEHNTLTPPKRKLALAKQLNLRPRQVEVWFQNRRARTKLKQTEVDCEYLKRCCETLTEENRKLHKELQELRALKASNPFHMQLPATTLTMCPSCERVATTSITAAATTSPSNPSPATTANPAADSIPKGIPFPIGRPWLTPPTTSLPHHEERNVLVRFR